MGLRNTLLGALVAVGMLAMATDCASVLGLARELGFLRRKLGELGRQQWWFGGS